MTPSSLRLLTPAALAPLLLLAGCSLLEPTPPLVATRWANAARGVTSPDTPEEEPDLLALVGPREDRRSEDLADLDGELELGEVVVRLEPGHYRLSAAMSLDLTRGSFRLEGAGAHKTRLVLDTEEVAGLLIQNADRVELRDLTIACATGGTLRIEDCPDVVVRGVVFASAKFGLDLKESTAHVASSVFAGCENGIQLESGQVTLRETAFVDCWRALAGDDAGFDIEACAFSENRDVLDGSIDSRSRIVGNLFAGAKQNLAWTGRPALAAHNLASMRDLGDRFGSETNFEISAVESFPAHVALPAGLDIPAVHFALERARRRGDKDPEAQLRDLGLEQAEVFALASQRALKAGDLPSARKAARISLRYFGDRPLTDAPRSVMEIAGLAN